MTECLCTELRTCSATLSPLLRTRSHSSAGTQSGFWDASVYPVRHTVVIGVPEPICGWSEGQPRALPSAPSGLTLESHSNGKELCEWENFL